MDSGAIKIKTFTPVSLKQYIKCFWHLTIGKEQPFYEEDILPDGHQEIIFRLSENPVRRTDADGIWKTEPETMLAGQTFKSYRIRMAAGTQLFGVRFYPHTLHTFFQLPVDLNNKDFLPLDSLMSTTGLWNCVSKDPSLTCIQLERYLCQQISCNHLKKNSFQAIDYVMHQLFRKDDEMSIQQYIQKTGFSGKYIDDLFKRYVGITPKMLRNIFKFNQFVQFRNGHPSQTLTSCAHASGYYDQSHLIKSCKQFTSLTPAVYFKNQRLITDHFTLL